MTTAYNRPEQFYPTREQERQWEGESQAKADELNGHDEIIVTLQDVNQAWNEQVKACDWYERCALFNGGGGVDDDFVEQAWEEMVAATEHAEITQELYDDQYRRRQWLENGRWVVEGGVMSEKVQGIEIDYPQIVCPECGGKGWIIDSEENQEVERRR